MKLRPHIFSLTAIALLSAVAATAQGPGTGAVAGTVRDPAGLPIQGASVVVRNEATAAERSVATSATGVFNAPLLSPGNYTLIVQAAGFDVGEAHTVRVVVTETSSVDFHLSIARLGSNVQVRADAEVVQAQSSTLGREVGPEAIEALPLSNRNYTQILSLSPGVVVGVPDATQLGRGTQDVTDIGQKTTANNIQFNGVDANNLSQNSAANDGEEVGVAVPAPDTILEFKVQTANYDASYGRGTGANVDVISRSGSNTLHGTVWEFLRNDALNANNFFSNLDGQPRPVLKQNQFGAVLQGPIRRDKTFFLIAYQGLRSTNGEGDSVTTVLPQLTSDRSAATLGAQFCPVNPSDPTRPAAPYMTHAGGTQVACDGSNINPVALAILNFKLPNGQFAVPSPQINLTPDPNAPPQIPAGQSTFATPATYNENQYTVNIDQVFSDTNQLSGRFFYARAPTIEPFSPNGASVPGWGTNELDQNTMFVLAYTHIFSPTLINVARFGFMRFDGNSTVANPISVSDLGTQTPTGAATGAPAPGVTIDGLYTIGDAGTPAQSQVTNSFIWQDTVSLTRGRHNLRMGAEFKRHQVMVDAPFSTTGLLDIRTFDDFLVGQSAAQNGSPSGISNVTISNGSSGLFRKDERYLDVAGFVQDDFRVTPTLTLNAGLRYEIFGAPVEAHGQLGTFDPAIASFIAPPGGTLSGFVVPSNFPDAVPAGVKQTSYAGLWANEFHDIAPRFGFAWRAANKPALVVRGGYGIYFDRISGGLVESLVTQPPFSTFTFLSDSSNGAASLQQPFAPVLPPNSAYPIFVPRIAGGGPTLSAVSPNITDPYTQEYNLNLQFGLPGDYLFEVGYVGTHSLHVVGCNEFNQSLLASPDQPINGATTNTAANVVQRVPYQGLSPGSEICESSYNSNYNGLLTSLNKRMGHGLQFLASYTFSRNLDETSGSSGGQVFEAWLLTNDQRNPSQAYGLTDFDRTQRAVLSFVYQTPHWTSLPGFADHALANWQVSGILVAQSGTPITVLDSSAGAVYGNFPFENRAERPVGNPYTSGSTTSRAINYYLAGSVFPSAPIAPFGQSPADTDFGNSSVGMLRGPGQRNIDMAVERAFPIHESQTLRFRAEFFNLTNTPNFANPDNNLSDGAKFGKITQMASNPRIIQFAVKYSF